MIPTVSQRAVRAAAIALLIAALYGAYRGFSGASSEVDVAAQQEGLLPTASALAARQASPVAEPAAAALTEAQIRTIARQEAQAALTARDAPPPSEAPQTPAPSPGPAPSAPAPAPPPAAASEANQPPLF